MNVGDCYKTEIVGGFRYYRIVSSRGSGMFIADEVTITNSRITIEMDSRVMDWYFRSFSQINPVEYEHAVQNAIWTLELVKIGEKRNGISQATQKV